MKDRKCPHLQIHYLTNRNFNRHTGAPDHKPDGWYCDWCDQEFISSPNRCCERDDDRDGNCDIHSAPGVLRNKAFN